MNDLHQEKHMIKWDLTDDIEQLTIYKEFIEIYEEMR